MQAHLLVRHGPLSLIANAASILGALLPTSIADICQGVVKDRLRFG